MVYLDTRKVPTAGYGHRLTAEEVDKYPVGSKIDQSMADKWFKADSSRALNYADSFAERGGGYTNGVVKDVLADMSYQMGNSGVDKFEKFHSALHEGDFKRASQEVLNSKYAQQTPDRAKENADKLARLAEEK